MKCRMMFLAVLATTCLSLGWSSTVTAAPITLDDFSVPNPANTFNFNSSQTVTNSGVGDLNATRTVTLNVISASSGLSVFSIGGGTTGNLDLNSNSSHIVEMTLAYTGFTPFSLPSGANIQLPVQFHDRKADIKLTIVGSSTQTIVQTVPTINVGDPIHFANFVLTSGINNITDISFSFNYSGSNPNRNGYDIILAGGDQPVRIFQDVPEPGTLATLGLIGVVGGLALRRRLRKGEVA
ncbi:PEP-CTERM sorting domain-containing protein [Thermogemmata fonticola]|uniref:PEP-CTERM sorting domain-containing protein n=1 Tax=Thermogemmata fonticola TaxID=2755323 RepID=A0A7V8VFK1_9BACT|nr:PEP-CTERM sorting domain-containing protein [Thermogemmata fonticola]MBA2227115.1 PEP-CTERM sorting domain-containing protein [Thermogemmata fonticola]